MFGYLQVWQLTGGVLRFDTSVAGDCRCLIISNIITELYFSLISVNLVAQWLET